MSTTSARRLKERGGKITASMPTKNLTPVAEKHSFSSARKPVGKENPNPRSISRVSGPALKQMIHPMARMSTDDSAPRSRPRGRSPSPSDFNRILSDLRKTRVSSDESLRRNRNANGISSGGLVGSGGKGLKEGGILEKKGFRDLSQRVDGSGVNGFRVRENSNDGDKFRTSNKKVVGERSTANKLLSGKHTKEGSLPVNYVVSIVNGVQSPLDADQFEKDGNFSAIDNIMDGTQENGNLNDTVKLVCAPFMEKSETLLSSKESGVRNLGNSKSSDVPKKGINEGEMSVNVGNNHANKLQEKLAFLEGKVKKIASDIKKTKEVLDMNNTDASKVMLSDIQEKISGIEVAMGNFIAEFDANASSDCSVDSGNSKVAENDTIQGTVYGVIQNNNPAKISVKGLSGEDLEARLLPHHKLLWNRTSLKPLSSGSQINGNHVSWSNSVSDSGNPMSPIDENLIATEFLASLNKDRSWFGATHTGVEIEDTETSVAQPSSSGLGENQNTEIELQADERLDDFDDVENRPAMIVEEEIEDDSISRLIEIGRKTSTGGWFVSEGESVLLANDDGSCSFYDVANQEEKAEYRPPRGVSNNLWRDCWIIRAPSADGCSGKYVIAASAGNTIDAGFCSWDFLSKEVRAFHTEDNKTSSRLALGRLPDNVLHRRNALADIVPYENRQWWYRPCGPLIVSTATCQRVVKVFDIRDGEQIMKWDVQKPVLAMDYCSPLQWRNRGKVVVAETEAVSLWDVNSQNPHALLSVSTSGRRISALHVNNTDAELGGGVRQRVSPSEAEGNDGVFCTVDSINILDFRHPSGIGLNIPKIGVNVDSLYSRGDSVFLGCSGVVSLSKNQSSGQVLQFSLRKQKIINTYQLPESNAHSHHRALTQVWGDSNRVMAVCGLGLFVFDAVRDNGLPSFVVDYSSPRKAKEVIGPDDLYLPSFDYLSSQILLISRDRPAMWRRLS